MNDIAAIIQSYRRQDNIPIIIKVLKEQSVKPKRIIVWNDNDGSGKDLHNLDKDVEVINTNTNYNGNWGAFLFTFLTDTQYIAVIDDDCPPAKDWFKFCIEHQKDHKGAYGRFGIVIKKDLYRDRMSIRSKVGELFFRNVDMIGHSYFFPKEMIFPMFSKQPPFWHNICDLHFSFMARYNGWRLYVPTVEKKSELPFNKDIKLIYDCNENAMYQTGNHIQRRDDYVRWAIKNGIMKSK